VQEIVLTVQDINQQHHALQEDRHLALFFFVVGVLASLNFKGETHETLCNSSRSSLCSFGHSLGGQYSHWWRAVTWGRNDPAKCRDYDHPDDH